jgi:hypothetical protein
MQALMDDCKTKNPPGETGGTHYMDGLVSKGNKIPSTILE